MLVDAPSTPHHRHEQVRRREIGGQGLPAGRIRGRDHRRRRRGPRSELVPDHVRAGRVVAAVPPHLEAPGNRRLRRVVRALETGFPAAVGRSHGCELVHAAERCLIVSGHEPGAHAPQRDLRTAAFQVGDRVLVQIVRRDDVRVGEPGLIEDPAGGDAELGEVSGVEANAEHLMTPRPQTSPHLDRVPHAFERVVGVDQEHAVVRHRLGIRLEGRELVTERHHPGMRMGSLDGNAIPATRRHVRRPHATTDERRPARRETAVRPLRPPEPEIQHRFPARRLAHPGRLRRDQGLEVDRVQQRGLDEQAVRQRALDPDERRPREYHRPLRHGRDVEPDRGLVEVAQKVLVEEWQTVVARQTAEIPQFVVGESDRREVIERGLQTRRYREATAERCVPEVEVEDPLVVRATEPPVAVRHRQLVQVGEEGAEPRGIHRASLVVRVPYTPCLETQPPTNGEPAIGVEG